MKEYSSFFYKKLVSLNPDKYKLITGDYLIEDYTNYLRTLLEWEHNLEKAKTISEWLESEI